MCEYAIKAYFGWIDLDLMIIDLLFFRKIYTFLYEILNFAVK